MNVIFAFLVAHVLVVGILFTLCKEARPLFILCAFVCVIKVSVPVSELVGVEEGRVEILPQKLVEDTDKDFTGVFL